MRAIAHAPLVALLVVGACADRAPEPVAEAPVVVSATTTSADGVPIRYDVAGRGDTLLVLVHGWGNVRQIWEPHLATLAGTHRVAALDLGGFGESGTARDEWTIQTYAQDVAAVVDDLAAERVILVGFSMGAAVALEAGAALGERTVGLVFVDDFHEPDATFTEADIDAAQAGFAAVLADSAMVRGFAFSPAAHDSLMVKLSSMMPAEIPDHWWDAFRWMHEWWNDDLGSAFARLRAPVASINSDRIPTNVEALRRHSPEFELYLVPGAGHLGVLWEDPARFRELLRQAIAGF